MDMWCCEARIRRREPVEQGHGQLTIQSNKKKELSLNGPAVLFLERKKNIKPRSFFSGFFWKFIIR